MNFPMNAILIVETFVSFVIAVTIHEAAHAAMALLLGDSTAEASGRLSLAPRRHMAAIGTIVAVVFSVSIVPGGLGWGKPVDVDARRMRPGANTGLLLVALAGPLTNLLLGLAVAAGLRFVPGYTALGPLLLRCGDSFGVGLQTCLSAAQPAYVLRLEQFAAAFAVTNIVLALINLIPLHPLDGYRVVFALLPDRPAIAFRRYEPYMELSLLALFFVLPWLLAFVSVLISPAGWFIGWANGIASHFSDFIFAFYQRL